MKRKIAVLIVLIGLLIGTVIALAETTALPVELAQEGQSEEGFVCFVAEDGTVTSRRGVDSFNALAKKAGIDVSGTLPVSVVPDNGEEYPYLYPEAGWKIVVYANEIPEWFAGVSDAVTAAFEVWKDEVYATFDVVALRETTEDSTLSCAPEAGYVPSEADIQAFVEYITVSNGLCTFVKTSVSDSIENVIGPSVTGDLWNYINRDIGEKVKNAGDVGSLLRAMGVSNVGVVQNDFSGAYTGSFFTDAIDVWDYYDGSIEGYPYESAVYLWQHGLTISKDSSGIWRMHNAATGEILYELADAEVTVNNAFACVLGDDGTVCWAKGLDNWDSIRAAFGLEADTGINVQVRPVLDESKALIPLPDGNNPDVTRYFLYLDGAAEWTVEPALDDDSAVLEAFEAWKEATYGGLRFDEAQGIFTDETQNIAEATDEAVDLLRQWAIAWHNLKDQGMDPTAAIIMSGHQGVGSSLWDDVDAYLLAAWRVQHAACPGDVAQATYFAGQGITEQRDYDHEIGDTIGNSVSDVMEALAGHLFDNIDQWAYYTGDSEDYPYEAGAQLVIRNLVPYTDGANWYLCSGANCDIVYQISEAELLGE